MSFFRIPLWAILVLGVGSAAARAEDEPPPADPAPTVELLLSVPADLRDDALRILSVEGVVATDPDDGETVEAPALPPVGQAPSVLAPLARVLARIEDQPLLVERVSVGRADSNDVVASPRLHLTLRARGARDGLARSAAELETALASEPTLAADDTPVEVRVEESDGRLRIRLRPMTEPPGTPPPYPHPFPIADLREHLSGGEVFRLELGRREHEETNEEGRYQSVRRHARLELASGDVAALVARLEAAESAARVSVVGVHFVSDGAGLPGPTPLDPGTAVITFEVRHPRMSSNDLHERLRSTAAEGEPGEPSTLRLRCAPGLLQPLARLLSVEGIELRSAADGVPIEPRPPSSLELEPGTAELLGAVRRVFGPSAFEVVAIRANSWSFTLTLHCDAPRAEVDAKGNGLQPFVEERLQRRWKSFAVDPFVKERVGNATIGTARVVSEDDSTVRASVDIDMDLIDAEGLRRRVEIPTPEQEILPHDALERLGDDHGIRIVPTGTERRAREGIRVVTTAVAWERLDLAALEALVKAFEGALSATIEMLRWTRPSDGDATSMFFVDLRAPLWPAAEK